MLDFQPDPLLENRTPKEMNQLAKGIARFGLLTAENHSMAKFHPILFFFSQANGMENATICTRARQHHRPIDGVALVFSGNNEQCERTVAFLDELVRKHHVSLPCHRAENKLIVDITALTEDLPKFSTVVKDMAHQTNRRVFLGAAATAVGAGALATALAVDGVVRWDEGKKTRGAAEMVASGGALLAACTAGEFAKDLALSPEEFAIMRTTTIEGFDCAFRYELTQIMNPKKTKGLN